MKPLLLGLLIACGPSGRPPPAPPVPPVPMSNELRGCAEAAAGIERGTRSIRPPEISVVHDMRGRCLDDRWPVIAIECFTKMTEDDLGRCVGELAASSRERMLVALAGGHDDRTAIAIAHARLVNLEVGIAECDRFVTTVARAMDCERMSLETRAQLGTETADFWSLPTEKLSAVARTRMAGVCGQSLAALQQEITRHGCM